MPLKIREAISVDAKYIHRLAKDSLPVFYDVKETIMFILNKEDSVSVAELDDENIVGYSISSKMTKKRFHVKSFAVDQNKRRGGIGNALMRDIVKRAVDMECYIITLYVMDTNISAISFYERFGFKKIGTKKNYYGYGIDGFVYALSIK